MQVRVKDRYDPRKILYYKEKIRMLLSGRIPIPVCVEIDPVDGFCNHCCVDCSCGSNPKKAMRQISTNVLIPAINEMAEIGIKGIEWVGGSEPTLHPDISLFLTTAFISGIKNGLITNGILLPRITQNALNGELEYIRISLDAGSPEIYRQVHGVDHFSLVLANIKRLISAGVNKELIGVSYRIMPENVEEMAQAAKLAEKLGVSYIQYKYSISEKRRVPAYLEERILHHSSELARHARITILGLGVMGQNMPSASVCLSSPLTGVIDANGDMPFCIQHRYDRGKNIGNIRDGFLNVWQGERHLELFGKQKQHSCPLVCKHHRYNKLIQGVDDDIPDIENGEEINIDFC